MLKTRSPTITQELGGLEEESPASQLKSQIWLACPDVTKMFHKLADTHMQQLF